jgi:Tfp pilus assembly protein PilF
MTEPHHRSPPLSPKAKLAIVAFALGVLTVVVVLLIVRPARAPKPPPGPASSAPSADAASTFYVGVAALDVDDVDRARAKLTRLTELAPDEAASWANLGLLDLRLGNFDAAAPNLEKARQLAPADSRIESLLGLLETRRGAADSAVAHFRRAVELDPRNLRARYAIAVQSERAGGDAGDQQAQQQLGEILKRAPDNLAVLLDALRLVAKRGNAAAANELLTKLEPMAPHWPENARQQFAAVRGAIDGGNVRAAATQVAFLKNVLAPLPKMRQDRAKVESPPQRLGEPIETPITLPAASATPAPPDDGITFTPRPLEGAPKPAVAIAPIWLTGDSSPRVVVAGADAVRIVGGDGAARIELPVDASLAVAGRHGIVPIDFNDDFRTDVALAGAGGFRLFTLGEDGKFTDVTAAAQIDPSVRDARCDGAWAADVDLDGDLDLVVADHDQPPAVLRNNGDGTFALLHPFENVTGVRDFVWADLDNDGAPDAAMIDGGFVARVFANERGGHFVERQLPPIRGVALAAVDGNNDGTLDLVVLQSDGALLLLESGDGGNRWVATTLTDARDAVPTGSEAAAGASLVAADVDNNGGIDLIASLPQMSRVMLAGPSGTYTTAPAKLNGQVSGAADIDGDGTPDLIGIAADGAATAWTTRPTKQYHWQVIRPRAKNVRGDGRINSFGIGGQIDVRTGLLVQTRPIDAPVVHFGIGTFTTSDVARIVWPNGSPQAEFELAADQSVAAEQRLKGSCPSLFAWDGTRMRFVKDCAPWSPALGLAINAQQTADIHQTQEWQKIPANYLRPRDGYYDLRITAELWETYYIDHFAMLAVDHPPNTEVFVDERFSIPPPKLKVYATQTPRPFALAVDDAGNDVSAIVASSDGVYLDNFGRCQYQGVTRDHFVELDLPPAAPLGGPAPVYLIAHGWLHPTDASVNIAISQGRHEPPRVLSLEVADGAGGWKVAEPSLGFPAGKQKTCVIDLSNVFIPGAPRRLRLRTNMEIYWDELQWAVGLPDDSITTRRLTTSSAELRYRGFSKMSAANASSPEVPDYDEVLTTGQRWRDLEGFYTRYGDIEELLAAIDDRIVIVNGGDEMRFRFAVPGDDPPAGWTRDFVWIGDGWIKDGDFNSRFSKTVIPLATHETVEYTRPPTRLEDEPAYQRHPDDWGRYHTRYVAPDDFRAAPRPRG